VAYVASAKVRHQRPSALLRFLRECPHPMALIRRVAIGWKSRLRNEALASAISGAARVARLVSYSRRKRNYRQLHLRAVSGRDLVAHLVATLVGSGARRQGATPLPADVIQNWFGPACDIGKPDGPVADGIVMASKHRQFRRNAVARQLTAA
jgi:hypothetical protein